MNDKRTISLPSIKLFAISCIFSIILGIIFHFTYNFLNKPFIIGLFLPINESIWEHLKLVLVPITAFGILYNIIYRSETDKLNNFWYYISKAIILSMLIIVFGHYGYKFIFKEVPDIFNLILYFISMITVFYKIYMNIQIQSNNNDNDTIINKNRVGIITLIVIFFLFILFTIYPPQIELFKDPVNNTFGIFMLE